MGIVSEPIRMLFWPSASRADLNASGTRRGISLIFLDLFHIEDPMQTNTNFYYREALSLDYAIFKGAFFQHRYENFCKLIAYPA